MSAAEFVLAFRRAARSDLTIKRSPDIKIITTIKVQQAVDWVSTIPEDTHLAPESYMRLLKAKASVTRVNVRGLVVHNETVFQQNRALKTLSRFQNLKQRVPRSSHHKTDVAQSTPAITTR